jgi:hypothetical protein
MSGQKGSRHCAGKANCCRAGDAVCQEEAVSAGITVATTMMVESTVFNQRTDNRSRITSERGAVKDSPAVDGQRCHTGIVA